VENSDPQPQSPGALLRAERERRGISPREMADRLNWMPAYVTAIEENRFEVLRGTAFVRGYLRAYGKQLGLAEAELLKAFEAMEPSAVQAQSTSKTLLMNNTPPRWRQPDVGIAAGVACAVILVFALWWVQSTPDVEPSKSVAPVDTHASGAGAAEELTVEAKAQPSGEETGLAVAAPVASTTQNTVADAGALPDSSSLVAGADSSAEDLESDAAELEQASGLLDQSPAPADPAPAAIAILGEEILQFSFSGDCWIEVRDGNEKLIYADLRRDGDTLALDGAPPFSILVGDARKVRLQYAGQPVDIVPPPGRVVTRFRVGES